MITTSSKQGVIDVPMQCYSGGVLDVFIEPNLPRPHMVIVGHCLRTFEKAHVA